MFIVCKDLVKKNTKYISYSLGSVSCEPPPPQVSWCFRIKSIGIALLQFTQATFGLMEI